MYFIDTGYCCSYDMGPSVNLFIVVVVLGYLLEYLTLTCGAATLVLDGDWLLALCFDFQAGALQCAAALVRHAVGSADIVVALTDADSQFVLFILVAFDALQSGTAAARCRASAATQLSLRGGAHWAAAAGVQLRAGGAAFRRERSALSRVTGPAARTRRDTEREERQERNHRQKDRESLHDGLIGIFDADCAVNSATVWTRWDVVSCSWVWLRLRRQELIPERLSARGGATRALKTLE